MVERIAPATSLRRADWRFLLPPPPDGGFEHLVVLGGPAGLADRLREVGLARRVSCDLPRARSADAVAILHDAPIGLRAAGCLRPGGALYYEVDRRRRDLLAATPGRVQRELRAAGLTPAGVYWVAPSFAGCKRYLPLDVPAILRWYLATLYVAGTPAHRLVESAVRLSTGLDSRRFGRMVPCYAVTAGAGAGWSAPSVLAHPALPPELRPPGLRPVVLTSGQDDGSRVVVLPFAPGAAQPAAVLKVATLADFSANTEREQATLADLRARLDPAMRETIPRPLGALRYGDLAVGVESYAPGRSLWVSSGRWRAPLADRIDDLRLAAGWLAEFHRQAQIGRPQWGDPERARWVELPLAAYARSFGLNGGEQRLFAALRRYAGTLDGADFPIIWQHNDFGPWNLYRDGQRLTVVDWEFGRDWADDGRCGPALCDLIYFAAHWSYIVRRLAGRAAELRGFQALLLDPDRADPLARTARQAIDEYMAAVGLDRRLLPLLLVYTWVERALDHFDRKRALGRLGADARAGNQFIGYVDLLAAHAVQLFGTEDELR